MKSLSYIYDCITFIYIPIPLPSGASNKKWMLQIEIWVQIITFSMFQFVFIKHRQVFLYIYRRNHKYSHIVLLLRMFWNYIYNFVIISYLFIIKIWILYVFFNFWQIHYSPAIKKIKNNTEIMYPKLRFFQSAINRGGFNDLQCHIINPL